MTDAPITFKVPSREQVLSALARLGNLQLRRVFYSKLFNPLWVTALHVEGAFSNPPAPKPMPDGSYRVDPWPEIDYLVKMASLVPDEVTAVLESIADSDNPWVRRGVWEAAACLPAKNAGRLVPKMKTWIDQSLANSRTDPRDVVRTIINLLKGGTQEYKKGEQLANVYYAPRPAFKEPEIGLPDPRVGLDPYWYAKTLPEVSAALGRGRLRTLIRWLEKYQEYAGYYDPDSLSDASYIWRPSVRAETGYHVREVANSLVEAVRSAAVDTLQTLPDSFGNLFKSKQSLLQRIALDVLTAAMQEMHDISTDTPRAKLTDRQNALVSYSVLALGNASFAEFEFRTEYIPFVQACASWTDRIDLTQFVGIVEDGPAALKDSRRLRLVKDGDDETPLEERVEEYRAHWQHSLLSAIGKNSLPRKLQALLAKLDSQFGIIDNPNTPAFEISSFNGPISPVDQDSIRNMSDDDLINHLHTWRPNPSEWQGPSHDGQGRVLTEAIASQPGRLTDRVEDIKTLRPTYIRSILRGWQLSLDTGYEFLWDPIVTLCEWVSNLSDDEQVDNDGDIFNDDSNYRSLKFQALQLLESGLRVSGSDKKPSIPVGTAESIGAILSTFANHSEPTPDYEQRYGGNSMDPLSLSLNTIRPLAIRSLIRLIYRFPNAPASTLALTVLEQKFDDPSTSVSAVFGEGAGRLYDSARTWLEVNTPVIFGNSEPTTPKQQVALSTALAVHQYHPALLRLLRPSLLTSLKESTTIPRAMGWRTIRSYEQLIGDWILMGFVTGTIFYEDELMKAWFVNTEAEVRGDVLGHVGWQLMHWTEVAGEVLARIGDLWDRRAAYVAKHPDDFAELSGFYWYVKSEKFDVGWWLPRLLDVTRIVSDFQSHGMIGEQLAKAATVDAATTLEIVENLLAVGSLDDQLDDYDIREHAVPQAIASALDANEEGLTKRASHLLNRLGASGYIDLEQRVTSRRKGVASRDIN